METTVLKFTTERKDECGNNWQIIIRLDDDCNNGHQDFSITGTCWEKGKKRTDNTMIYGGACGDSIVKFAKEFKIFNTLHLCDYNGAPMYAVSNAIYWAKEKGKKEMQEYLRLTDEETDQLYLYIDDEISFKYNLEKLGVIKRWKEEADEAIKLLEELTGNTFKNVSIKSNYIPLTKEEIKRYEDLTTQGYYTTEQILQRKEDAIKEKLNKQIEQLKSTAQKNINKINTELNIRIAILEAGYPIDNFIYYDHKNEGIFNWLNYNNTITKEDFDNLLEKIDKTKLPQNLTLKLEKNTVRF